jgi:hypothetical protein
MYSTLIAFFMQYEIRSCEVFIMLLVMYLISSGVSFLYILVQTYTVDRIGLDLND